MFENLWEFVCAHWIWFPVLIIGGFVYINIGYLLLLAKLKVAKRYFRYIEYSHTYLFSIDLGFWTFIIFPWLSFQMLGRESNIDAYVYAPDALKYLTCPEEEKNYPYLVTFLWPLMVAGLMLFVVCLLCSFLFHLIRRLILTGLTGLFILIFRVFTMPIRKFLLKLVKPAEGQK
ncbi:MAG: hypothetical protein UT32_C0017G0018 [Parcubacteria group bacterium GW2011_GWC2_39_14]|nr:MAG: hypothetical protein UT32_C0017G0018 [Parcubacteria group bacterium GW2011_GWC2_39_14]